MKTKLPILLLACICICSLAFSQTREWLTNGAKVEKRMGKGEVHLYQLNIIKGGYCYLVVNQLGVDLAIDLLDEAGKLITTYDSPNGTEGPEPLPLETAKGGLHQLRIYPLAEQEGMTPAQKEKWQEENQGRYTIDPVTILSAADAKAWEEKKKAEQAQLIQWVSENKHPLTSVEAGHGFEDLQWMKEALKDVRFLGLGEATHGTREFFQMKHRMLEFLVKEMGYTVFAIEASYSGCRNINDYVLHGKGDAKTALASQGFWTWNTEEVLGMIEWMRSYNLTVGDERKVKFLGFDIQVNTLGGGVKKLGEFLKKTDTAWAAETAPLLQLVSKAESRNIADMKKLDSIRLEFERLALRLAMSRGHLVHASSAVEYEEALQYALVIAQYADAYLMKEGDPRRLQREWRDYYMASNFKYLVQQEKPGTKFVVWAHNGHISKNKDAYVNGGPIPFGNYLRESYGAAYYPMGFFFARGSFQAWNMGNKGKKGLREFTVSYLDPESIDALLAAAGQSPFILNLRLQNPPEFTGTFFTRIWKTRSFGSMANEATLSIMYDTRVPGKDYDALIFIPQTTRAVPVGF